MEDLLQADFGRVLERFLLPVGNNTIIDNFCILKIRPIVCSCSDSKRVFVLSAPTHFMIFIQGCRSFYFHSLIKATFLVSETLLCLYDKQNDTWLLVDMKFFFPCSTRHITRSLRSLVSYRVKNSHVYYLLSLYIYIKIWNEG